MSASAAVPGILDATPTQSAAKVPPGPRGTFALGRTQLEFLRGHEIEFLRTMTHRWGPVSSFWLGTFRTYLVCDTDLIEEVLMDRRGVFAKDAVTHDLDGLVGQGLLTSEGDLWKRQRKLAAPALTRRQIEAYADWMVELTEQAIQGWSAGEEIELHHEMMALTLKIVVKTLFNLELPDAIDTIGRATDDAMEVFHKKTHTLWRFVPDSIPTALSRKFDGAVAALDEVVYDLIRRRRADGTQGDDLLYRLLIANDEDGEGMSDQQLRDEVITMMLAGHETTALAVTYAWFLLSSAPRATRKLYAEIDEVLGNCRATAADIARLPYLKAVVQETLRMYSPAWIVGREALQDTTLGPWFVPRGTQVLTPQSVVHFDEKYFDAPWEFRPERWLEPDFEKSLPRFAYFPFGGGKRVCIGNHFAMMEAMLMIATMAQSFELQNVMRQPMQTQPAVTLRPVVPVSMRVHRR